MNDDFYRAFEDKFRGSRELIKSRHLVYLPFIEPLRSLYEQINVIDLGCGRGEWLELLRDCGFDGHGVDLDDGMLAACRERGLSVITNDAISALRELPDESQAIVSGFHIAEHLPFSNLRSLVQEALRVLKPAGLLILETPNPENLVVGSSSFYLDPSHERPIPWELLSFLAEHSGFERTKVLRLHESAESPGNRNVGLLKVLNGVSPDYAVVAQKSAETELMARFNEPFQADYGASLEMLAQRHDQQMESRVQLAESRAQQAESLAQQVEEFSKTIYASRSWRFTAPLRSISEMVSRIKQKINPQAPKE